MILDELVSARQRAGAADSAKISLADMKARAEAFPERRFSVRKRL